MNTNTLPTEELKKYGIIDSENSFTKKLSAEDITKFLMGDTIIAENEKKTIQFKLTDNNSKLNVQMFEKDRNYKELLKSVAENPNKIQYTFEKEIGENKDEKNFTRLAFIMLNDKDIHKYDMVKDAIELTQIIAGRKNTNEINTYKTELEKLQSYLQDKIDKYPEAAKQITENLNIVSNEINSVNSISSELNNSKANNTEIRLDVNDDDIYQDVNTHREEEYEEEENFQEDLKRKGFKR